MVLAKIAETTDSLFAHLQNKEIHMLGVCIDLCCEVHPQLVQGAEFQ